MGTFLGATCGLSNCGYVPIYCYYRLKCSTAASLLTD